MSDPATGTMAPVAALLPLPPGIGKLAAPLMFGILVSWMFYGMLVVQVYIYHIFFKDKLSIKLFVYGIFLLDTLQTCMTGADAFYWFCSGFGDITHLGNVYISFFDTPMLGSLMALVVQSFFCYRIWMLSKSIIAPVILWLLCLMSTVAAWFSGIRGHLHGNLSAAQAQINTRVLEVWLIGSVIADTLIAACLIYLLMRNRSNYSKTNAVLQRLVRITMETNSLSASLAILALILYFAAPGTSYFLTPTYYFGKIYANSLLVTLNNRFFLAAGHMSNSNMGSKQSGRNGYGGTGPYTEVSTFSATLDNSSSAAAVTSFKIPPFGGANSVELNKYDASDSNTVSVTKAVNVI